MKSIVTTGHFIILLLFIVISCNSKNNKENNPEKGTGLTENMEDKDGASSGILSDEGKFVFTGINEELLWEIYLKIPPVEEHYFFATREQRLKARLDGVFHFDPNVNRLDFDDTNGDGVRNFIEIICYPKDDGEKILAIFFHGGGVDIYGVSYDKTYEYDIATGNITEIERPVDPYTFDELVDESILTPKQLKALQNEFNKEWPYTYFITNKEGFGRTFEAYNAFEEWDDYEEYIDLMRMFYIYGEKIAYRNWNGKRFVKVKDNMPDYLISSKAVGRFEIGAQIALPYPPDEDIYRFERSERTETREGSDEKIIEYTFVEYNDTMLIVKPLYDYDNGVYTDKTGEIIIYSENYKTKEKIGINTSIDDFITMYPNNKFWWTYVSDTYVLESEDIDGNVQFVLNADDCIITPSTDSDMTILKRSDFKKDAKIKKIRVF